MRLTAFPGKKHFFSGKLTFDPCILLLLEGDSFSDEK